MNTFIVIPAYRPRLSQLRRCLQSVRWPAEKVVVVSNGLPHEWLVPGDIAGKAIGIQDDDTDINISRWWTQGMDYAISQGATEVLLLNCDALISKQGIQTLGRALYDLDCSVVGPDYRGVAEHSFATIRRSNRQIPWWERVPGFCMMVRVEEAISDYYQIYPDEEMRWWYSDDDIEWQAREARGTALVPGVDVKHPPSGGTLLNDTLGRYAQEDLAKFVAKWGCEPCLPMQ